MSKRITITHDDDIKPADAILAGIEKEIVP